MACRRSLPQRELTRFHRDASGKWQLDRGVREGRGAWLCQSPDCRTNKALGRFFRAQAAGIATELREREEDGGLNV